MTIHTYGSDRRMAECARLLRAACPIETDITRILLLPIPTTNNGSTVRESDEPLTAVTEAVTADTLTVGYALPPPFFETEGRVLDLSRDEDFLVGNADLTARGMLGILLTEGNLSSSDRIGIIGFGRIGKALLRLLLPLGVRVRVYTGKEATRLRLGTLGISTGESRTDGGVWNFSGITQLINTAPTDERIESERPLCDLLVYDLASGGPHFAEHAGVRMLPGLPGKLFAKEAGRLCFDAVMRTLSEAGT